MLCRIVLRRVAGLQHILVFSLVGRSAPRPIIYAAGADDVLAAASTCHRELTGHPESEGERGGGLAGGV